MSIRTQRGSTRFGVAAIAAALIASLFAFASPAGAAQNVTELRISGADRYATAANVAQSTFGAGQTNIVLASGENFPDGLAAAGLAGALNAPILLTAADGLPSSTANALGALFTGSSLKNVHIVGGEAAVSAAVANQLAAYGYTVKRVSGANRYETAAKIADAAAAVNPIGTTSVAGISLRTAILATGENFPDALAGGAPAFSGVHPIILTASESLSDSAKSALADLGIQRVIILGGTAAVSTAVETSVNGLGIQTTRVSGADRGATAAALAGVLIDTPVNGGFGYFANPIAPSSTPPVCVGTAPTNAVLIVSGSSAWDAMAAAPHAAKCSAPILVAGSAATAGFLGGPKAMTSVGVVKAIGGTAAVSAAELTAAKDAATTATPTATVSATLGDNVIKVVFSEAMSATAGGDIKVNNGTDICVTTTSGTSTPNTALAANTCHLITPAGQPTTLYAKAAANFNPGDTVVVSGFAASNTPTGRVMTPASITIPSAPVALTATIEGAVQGATSFKVVYNQPVTLTGTGNDVTIKRSTNVPVDQAVTAGNPWEADLGLTATVTVAGLTGTPTGALQAGDVIVVATNAATRVAGGAGEIAAPLTLVVPGPGAKPVASSVTGTVADVGGVLILPEPTVPTDPVAQEAVTIRANNARPATGVGSIEVAYVQASAPGTATSANAVLDNTNGVTTITVTLGTDATGTPNATNSAVATALGATGLVTATAAVPNTAITGPIAATPIAAGTRTLTATVTATKPLSAINTTNIVYDGAGNGFNTAPVASSTFVVGSSSFQLTFNLGVGASARPNPTNGVSTLRFTADAMTDQTAQGNVNHVTAFSAS